MGTYGSNVFFVMVFRATACLNVGIIPLLLSDVERTFPTMIHPASICSLFALFSSVMGFLSTWTVLGTKKREFRFKVISITLLMSFLCGYLSGKEFLVPRLRMVFFVLSGSLSGLSDGILVCTDQTYLKSLTSDGKGISDTVSSLLQTSKMLGFAISYGTCAISMHIGLDKWYSLYGLYTCWGIVLSVYTFIHLSGFLGSIIEIADTFKSYCCCCFFGGGGKQVIFSGDDIFHEIDGEDLNVVDMGDGDIISVEGGNGGDPSYEYDQEGDIFESSGSAESYLKQSRDSFNLFKECFKNKEYESYLCSFSFLYSFMLLVSYWGPQIVKETLNDKNNRPGGIDSTLIVMGSVSIATAVLSVLCFSFFNTKLINSMNAMRGKNKLFAFMFGKTDNDANIWKNAENAINGDSQNFASVTDYKRREDLDTQRLISVIGMVVLLASFSLFWLVHNKVMFFTAFFIMQFGVFYITIPYNRFLVNLFPVRLSEKFGVGSNDKIIGVVMCISHLFCAIPAIFIVDFARYDFGSRKAFLVFPFCFFMFWIWQIRCKNQMINPGSILQRNYIPTLTLFLLPVLCFVLGFMEYAYSIEHFNQYSSVVGDVEEWEDNNVIIMNREYMMDPSQLDEKYLFIQVPRILLSNFNATTVGGGFGLF